MTDTCHQLKITLRGVKPPVWRDELNENIYRSGDVLTTVGSRVRWDYDFGDGWEHDLVVEGIAPPDPNLEYPVCLAGRRACPPEDCGGPLGYADLLTVLADPGHPEYEDLVEWAPPNFDPDFFDIDEANVAMRSPRPLEFW